MSCKPGWAKPHGHWELVYTAHATAGEHLCSIRASDIPYPEPPPEDGDRWGPWRYAAESQELVYARKTYDYGVDLDRCRTPVGAVNWVLHMADKRWVTESDLGWLIRALQDLRRLRHIEPDTE